MRQVKCKKCNLDTNLTDMIKDRRMKMEIGLYCKKCMRKTSLENRIKNPINSLYAAVKSSAKKRGLEFNISINDIVFPEKCPYLGIDLSVLPGVGLKNNTASIDRIDNSKGYVKGNIQVISLAANRLKSNLSEEELLTLAKNIIKLHSKSSVE